MPVGIPEGSHLRAGHRYFSGDCWSPGAALARSHPFAWPAADAAARRAASNPGICPHTVLPPRPRTSPATHAGAREQPAATSTRATTPSRGLIRGKPKILAPARFGEKCAPRTTSEEWCLVSRNLSRAPTASLRDRLRRHSTEPVRPRWTSGAVGHIMVRLPAS